MYVCRYSQSWTVAYILMSRVWHKRDTHKWNQWLCPLSACPLSPSTFTHRCPWFPYAYASCPYPALHCAPSPCYCHCPCVYPCIATVRARAFWSRAAAGVEWTGCVTPCISSSSRAGCLSVTHGPSPNGPQDPDSIRVFSIILHVAFWT